MATTDQVRRLIDSHQRGDEPGFQRAVRDAFAAAAEHQDTLAFDLESIAANAASEHSRPLHVNTMRPLPVGRGDHPLLTLTHPRGDLGDLVLTGQQTALLQDVLREHRNRDLLAAKGLYPRTTLLLAGPSGTGKTRTAEALAGELGVPLLTVRLSAVVSSYLGETSANLESVLDYASTGSWVLAFDEIDMLAAERGREDHGEMRRVSTALLQTLEYHHNQNLVVATTNHPDLLDRAMWRRFDEVIAYRLPTQAQIEQLVKLKLRRAKSRVNRREIARALAGSSPADVEKACNDAMRAVTLEMRPVIETHDVIAAGLARRARMREAMSSLRLPREST